MKYAVSVVHETIIAFTSIGIMKFHNLDFSGLEIAYNNAEFFPDSNRELK
jgi:hypothetical protein